MKAEIEGGRLSFDVEDLVRSLDDDGKAQLAKHLAFDATLLGAVVGVVGDGICFVDDWWFDADTNAQIRQRLIPLLPKVTQDLVTWAFREMEQAKLDAKRYSDWAWGQYHARRDGKPAPELGPLQIAEKDPQRAKEFLDEQSPS